jgi:hypothetical protein
LGGWRVTVDGRPAATGAHQKIVLHALVLGRGQVDRGDLIELLPNDYLNLRARQQSLRNTLSKLRRLGLDVTHRDNPVMMPLAQPNLSVDLWEFFAHADFGRHEDAFRMIAAGEEPTLLPNDEDPENVVWSQTLQDFDAAKAKLTAALAASSDRRRSTDQTRAQLLARRLVPGVGQPVAIGDVRERLEPLAVPWRVERPETPPSEPLLPEYLASLLTRGSAAFPHRVLVVGPAGAGKTLAAISTFLRLTEHFERSTLTGERPVLYIDAETEGHQEGFGSDAWLKRRLREAGADTNVRPIVILSQADGYLAQRQHELRTVLDSWLFRDTDLLVCCGTQIYTRRLCYEDFGTHVIHLEHWDRDLQRAFARAVVGEETAAAFDAWCDEPGTPDHLCRVPLQLVHVLSLLASQGGTLTGISRPWELFEEVARMRLRVSGTAIDEDELLQDLATVAHRFFADARAAGQPIRFSSEELKLYLDTRPGGDGRARATALIGETLLTASPAAQGELRFEASQWGWFFTARHLVHTLLYDPSRTVAAFSKFLSADVMDLCEQMLRGALERHANEIHSALRLALHDRSAAEIGRGRQTIAREQIGYLLGALGDRGIREELAPLVADGSAAREADTLVRRGITLGLADGGAREFADSYVEALRRERDTGGPSPERDANIGFLLSFRGDQRFDPDHPAAIAASRTPVRTVGNLVRGLEESHHSGSWRIKLFTLLDLGAHPAVSHALWSATIAPYGPRLQAIAKRLEQDPETRPWPELYELRQLLDKPRVEAA